MRLLFETYSKIKKTSIAIVISFNLQVFIRILKQKEVAIQITTSSKNILNTYFINSTLWMLETPFCVICTIYTEDSRVLKSIDIISPM